MAAAIAPSECRLRLDRLVLAWDTVRVYVGSVKTDAKPKVASHLRREAIRWRAVLDEPVRDIARSHDSQSKHDF